MKYRLPNQETTDDIDYHINEWASLGEKLAEVLSFEDEKFRVSAFDPVIQLSSKYRVLSFAPDIAILIINKTNEL